MIPWRELLTKTIIMGKDWMLNISGNIQFILKISWKSKHNSQAKLSNKLFKPHNNSNKFSNNPHCHSNLIISLQFSKQIKLLPQHFQFFQQMQLIPLLSKYLHLIMLMILWNQKICQLLPLTIILVLPRYRINRNFLQNLLAISITLLSM